MIVAAMYLLYMVGRVVFGPTVEPHGHEHHGHAVLPRDLTAREIWTLLPLAAGCLALGVYPQPALDALREPNAATIGIVRGASQAAESTPALGAAPGVAP
jgi:NADH-quinone oxidoreductase subunit M